MYVFNLRHRTRELLLERYLCIYTEEDDPGIAGVKCDSDLGGVAGGRSNITLEDTSYLHTARHPPCQPLT